MKTMYYYLFYVLYKFYDNTSFKWWSDWKATFSIDVLLFFIFSSIFYYWGISFSNGKLVYILIGLFISICNHFIFHHRDQWKYIIVEFDQLPKHKNTKGFIIVWTVIILIILNLICSVYYMDNRAKRNRTGPYSAGEVFIPGGWPAAIQAGHQNTFNNQSILGSSWNPRPGGGLGN